MHISEGILSAPVLAAGILFAAGGVSIGLKKLRYEKIPETAVLTSCFFIASLIHIPVGPSSVHLILNGLMGILLGWSAFPAILVGLLLQAILFQFGGLTTLGINTFNMAFPALISFWLFKLSGSKNIISFLCGAISVLCSALLVAASLFATGEAFLPAAKILVIAHIPVVVIEGLITFFVIVFLRKVHPELLG